MGGSEKGPEKGAGAEKVGGVGWGSGGAVMVMLWGGGGE